MIRQLLYVTGGYAQIMLDINIHCETCIKQIKTTCLEAIVGGVVGLRPKFRYNQPNARVLPLLPPYNDVNFCRDLEVLQPYYIHTQR